MHRRSARHWPRSRPARPPCSTSIAPAPTPATSTSSSIGGRRNDATYCVPDRRAAELCAAARTANANDHAGCRPDRRAAELCAAARTASADDHAGSRPDRRAAELCAAARTASANDHAGCRPDRRAAELCAAAPTANPMNDLLSGPPLTTRRRGTVLVVNDEEGVRASIRAILEETCEVLEAEHGAAALDILAQREVDLVMLDQRMPGESGVDVLPRVK